MEQAAAHLKKGKFANAIFSQQKLFPLQICTNHSYLTNNLTKAVRSSFNQTNVLKEGVLAACAVNTGGGSTQQPWAALHRAEPWAEEPLPEDVGNKDIILLQLQREPHDQDWIPGLKPASHHYNFKDECWFFKHNSNARQTEAESSSPALAFLKCRDTNSCPTELISEPCLKPLSALGVFGCPLLQEED